MEKKEMELKENSIDGTIPMGTFLLDEDEERSIVESSITEEKRVDDLQGFKEFCGKRPYVIFDKSEIAHFVDLVSYHSRLGYDNYTMSFKLDTTEIKEKGKATLIYNNGNVLAMSEVATIASEEVIESCIISVDTMLKIFSASRGYIFIFEEDKNLYSYVLGGKVYIETFKVGTDICSKEYLMDQLSVKAVEEYTVNQNFIAIIRMLYDIVRTGSRIEEKAIYFEGDNTYIYSGIVMGKFIGAGVNLTLQDIDISTVLRFFFDVNGDIKISDHDIFMKFSYGHRSVYLAKRTLKLSDDMKYQGITVNDNVTVNIDNVKSIVSFLINMANNIGILNIQPASDGVMLVCFQRTLDYNSIFKVKGMVSGYGISEVKIPLSILKVFMKVFDGNVKLKTSGNKLYISNTNGVGLS